MKVAIDSISITPSDAVGKPMAGYSRPHPARGILDEVKAHGVLLQHEILGNVDKNFLLISLDVLKPPMVFCDYVKEQIQEKFQINPNQILIHATHTHSAPDLTGEFYWPGGMFETIRGILFGLNRNDKMLVWMTNQIVKMVGRLLTKLQPAKIGWKKVEIDNDIIINRRHPARRTKPPLGVICFKGIDDNELIGMLVNVGAHGTTLSNMNDKISADYPGRVVASVNEMTNGKTRAVFFNAASGDLNPITTCGTDFDYLEEHHGPVYGQKGEYEDTIRIGKAIAKRALDLAKSIPDDEYYETIELKSYVRTFWFPMKDFKHYHSDKPLQSTLNRLQNRLIFLVKKYFMFPIVFAITGHDKEPNFPGLAIKHRFLDINIYTKIQYVQCKCVKDGKRESFNIITVPGEAFQNLANQVMEASPEGIQNSFMFQNSNDWTSYLFDLDEYIEAGGFTQEGYELLPSTTPIAGYYIKNEFFRLFDEINHGLVSFS